MSPDTIGIEGLSRNVTAAHIKEIFARYGDIQEVYLPVDRKTGHGRGGAKVRYSTADEAGKAIKGMHGGQLDGNVLQVFLCRTPAIRTRSDKSRQASLSRSRSPLMSPPSPGGPRMRGRARSRSYSRSRSRSRSHSYSPNRGDGYHYARGAGRRSPRSYHARSPVRR